MNLSNIFGDIVGQVSINIISPPNFPENYFSYALIEFKFRIFCSGETQQAAFVQCILTTNFDQQYNYTTFGFVGQLCMGNLNISIDVSYLFIEYLQEAPPIG